MGARGREWELGGGTRGREGLCWNREGCKEEYGLWGCKEKGRSLKVRETLQEEKDELQCTVVIHVTRFDQSHCQILNWRCKLSSQVFQTKTLTCTFSGTGSLDVEISRSHIQPCHA